MLIKRINVPLISIWLSKSSIIKTNGGYIMFCELMCYVWAMANMRVQPMKHADYNFGRAIAFVSICLKLNNLISSMNRKIHEPYLHEFMRTLRIWLAILFLLFGLVYSFSLCFRIKLTVGFVFEFLHRILHNFIVINLFL